MLVTESRKKWGGSIVRVGGSSEAALLLPGSHVGGSNSSSARQSSRLACLTRLVTVKRCVAALVLLSTISILYYTHYLGNHPFSRYEYIYCAFN